MDTHIPTIQQNFLDNKHATSQQYTYISTHAHPSFVSLDCKHDKSRQYTYTPTHILYLSLWTTSITSQDSTRTKISQAPYKGQLLHNSNKLQYTFSLQELELELALALKKKKLTPKSRETHLLEHHEPLRNHPKQDPYQVDSNKITSIVKTLSEVETRKSPRNNIASIGFK